jgi:hypothetical protein
MAILFLPGTFIHEVSHFLSALFLLVPVGELKLVPEFKGNNVRMGSVSISKTDPLRNFFIGIAPFIFGVGVILFTINLALTGQYFTSWWGLLLVGYIVFEVGNTMYLSKTDLKGIWEFIGIILLILLISYLLGISYPRLDPSLILSNEVVGLIERTSMFLLVPIAIDVVVLFIIDLLDR